MKKLKLYFFSQHILGVQISPSFLNLNKTQIPWQTGSLALTAGYKENEMCWCRRDFVSHLEASRWQTLPEPLHPLCLSEHRAQSSSLPHSLNWDEGSVEADGPDHGPAEANYSDIFCTFLNSTMTTLLKPILWSFVLIVLYSKIPFNNQRGVWLFQFLPFKKTAKSLSSKDYDKIQH